MDDDDDYKGGDLELGPGRGGKVLAMLINRLHTTISTIRVRCEPVFVFVFVFELIFVFVFMFVFL